MASWARLIAERPLIAILRGITPQEAAPVGEALAEAGFLCVEVPLNSPRPLETIEALRARFDGRLLVGAGTVLRPGEVEAVAAAGGQIIISPNADAAVIAAAKRAGLISLPGFFTPSEAFAALAAGADALKLFPAETAGPATLKAIRAVLPAEALVFPVGGIEPGSMAAWRTAGAGGFGIGSALYRPGATAEEVGTRARAFVEAFA